MGSRWWYIRINQKGEILNKYPILFVVLLALFPHAGFADVEPVKLGSILPLSGAAAYAGEACRNGMEMAQSDLSPQAKKSLQILYEDDANVPRKTAEAYQKLRLNSPTVITSFTSNTSLAIANSVDADGVVMFAIASDPKIVENRKMVFNLWVTPETEIQKLIPYVKKQGWKKLAVISTQQDGVISFLNAYKKHSLGVVETVLEDEVTVDEKDFKSFIMKARALPQLDAIFVNLYVGQTGVFAKQAKELHLNVPLINGETFESDSEVKDSQGALIGQAYVQAGDAGTEFLEEYRTLYPKASTVGAAHCHDVVKLIGAAIDQGKRSSEEIRSFLASLKDFNGALGTFSASGDNRFTLPAVMKRVMKDGYVEIPD